VFQRVGVFRAGLPRGKHSAPPKHSDGWDEIGDDELTVLALAADPDLALGDDAIPIGTDDDRGLLPSWYMPAPRLRGGGRCRRLVIATLIGALLVVNGVGLCVTYGFPEIAW
jgi:hypothetical protein